MAARDASTVRRGLTFRDPLEKARYLDFWAHVEAHAAPVLELVAARRWRDLPPSARAAAIHMHVRDGYRYVRDPGGQEELGDAGTVIGRRWDDCDGKARLFVALCTAAGLAARIRPVFKGPFFVHVQAEVRWPRSEAHAGADAAGWVPAELILAGVPLGSGAEAVQRDASGRVRYAG